MESERENNSDESPAPPRLVAALRRAQSSRVFVPRTVDEAVLRAARNHFAPANRRKADVFSQCCRWLAFATACLLLCAAVYRLSRPGPLRPGSVYAREDLNHDGRVDILDAFQLARQVQSGGKPEADLDLNRDGVVDRRDVDTIAALAVKLEKGRRS